MRILRLILLVLLLVIVVALVGGFVWFNDLTRGPLPQHSAELSINGLDARVEVLRDGWGVPHIYASTPHDLFFAQGYTQAQDRWWQMEFWRHIGSGRIEELTGKNEGAFGNDLYIRTAGWRHVAEQEAALLPDETRAMLQAFADGVNAYISNRAPGDLALEYGALGLTGIRIEVEPWTMADSISWGKVMQWDLSDDGGETLRGEIAEVVSDAMYAEYFPDWPYDRRPTVLQADDLAPLDGETAATALPIAAGTEIVMAGNFDVYQGLAFGKGEGIGSNNWVVAGSRSETGMPLLADDPHLGIQMPSLWYEIGLHCQSVSAACPFNVVGFALSAAPAVIIGHNDRIGWGVTDVTDDVVDYYRLRVNPDDPLQYEWNGAWRDMTTREETIRFGDGEAPVTIEVRETHLGPVINDHQLDEETGEIIPHDPDETVVIRWTALEPGLLFNAVLNLNRAQNWDDFRAALRDWNAPSQNFVYADVDGNIGYQTPGYIPIRAAGHDGLSTVDGLTDDDDWRGYIPFDLLPTTFNPPRGYIESANQAITPRDYADQVAAALAGEYGEVHAAIAHEWANGNRALRIVELLEAAAQHSIASFQQIQGDNVNVSAREIVPFLSGLPFDDAAVTGARDWLLAWDFVQDMDSPQAVLYMHFWARLVANLFDDQLPEGRSSSGGDRDMEVAYQLLNAPDSAWWDDVATEAVETRDDILTRSFAEGYAAAREALGDNRDNWRWGALHGATFVSNPLGLSGIRLIENIVNRGPIPVSGGSAIVNATGWNLSEDDLGANYGVPSMRMILDVGEWANSVTMHTTGQSGHPYSDHYDDMIESWRQIEYHPMLWTREQVDAAAENRLVLNPAG